MQRWVTDNRLRMFKPSQHRQPASADKDELRAMQLPSSPAAITQGQDGVTTR